MKNRKHKGDLRRVSGTITDDAYLILERDAAKYTGGNKSIMLERYIVSCDRRKLLGLSLLG